MSLHYILDGYNIVRHSKFTPQKKIVDARDSLLRLIEEKRPFGSPKNKVTIIFDGSLSVLSSPRYSSIEVIFSKGETADDMIKRLVERSGNPRRIVVVTDDRDLSFYVRSIGAVILSSSELLEKMRPRKAKEVPRVELSYSEMEEINRELRNLWLK